MKNIATFSGFAALCAAIFFLVAGSALRAQTAGDAAAKAPTAEELSQIELLKSYLRAQEQLHAAQLALANNRIEAEASARAQAAAIAQKIDGLKAAMDAERERQQTELRRVNTEREREQAEAQRTNRTVLWIAATFSCVGLLAMLFAPLFQSRALNRLVEAAARTPQLSSSAPPALLPGDAGASSEHAVALSNQRLLGVIDRMERRILELEHTAIPAVHPPTAAVVAPSNGNSANENLANASDPSRRATAASDQAAWIGVLLGKGKLMLAANKPREAIVSYDEILKFDDRHTEALVRKGVALERLKQDHEALRCYDRAIEVDRKMTLAYLYKGGVCNRLQRYEEAVECYEHALHAEEDGNSGQA